MKLSQPKSARAINKARVLGAIRREENLSKAELARILALNKVSIGEIVDKLIEEGFVEEIGKLESLNGRKATALKLIPSSFFVLSVDIESRNTTVSLCDLKANPVRFERIPTKTDVKVEEFCVGIIKSCIRVMKLVSADKIIGAGITVAGRISEDASTILECPYLPWKNIPLASAFSQVLKLKACIRNSTVALVLAERFVSSPDFLSSKGPVMYLNWGDNVNIAYVQNGKVFGEFNGFGHIKMAQTGLCWCGEIGCLETIISAWALSNNREDHLVNLWGSVSQEALSALGKALSLAAKITGSTKVIISGEGSTIPESYKIFLEKCCSELSFECSKLGEKANVKAAAEVALDEWVYLSSLLEEVKAVL
jgi:predicted NBD/HSP70 family sugar kinase